MEALERGALASLMPDMLSPAMAIKKAIDAKAMKAVKQQQVIRQNEGVPQKLEVQTRKE